MAGQGPRFSATIHSGCGLVSVEAAVEQQLPRYTPTALLDGMIPADWILGISCSQVFMNPIWKSSFSMIHPLGGRLPVERLYTSLLGNTFRLTATQDTSLAQRAIDQASRLYPDARRELCSNATCHRCSFAFGRCWNHGNLDETTHRNINMYVGGVNMRLVDLLRRMGRQRPGAEQRPNI